MKIMDIQSGTNCYELGSRDMQYSLRSIIWKEIFYFAEWNTAKEMHLLEQTRITYT